MVTFSDVFVVLLKSLIGLIDLVYSMFMNCKISCTFHLLVALTEHIQTRTETPSCYCLSYGLSALHKTMRVNEN